MKTLGRIGNGPWIGDEKSTTWGTHGSSRVLGVGRSSEVQKSLRSLRFRVLWMNILLGLVGVVGSLELGGG